MNGPGGVAIVGMACAYPDAPDPGALWETVMWRRRAFVPAGDGWRARLVHRDAFGDSPAKLPGIDPDSADPAHRLAAEVAGRALADAGIPLDSLDHDRLCVRIAGLTPRPARAGRTDADLAAGMADETSLASLVAACQALLTGEADLALAGGVHLGVPAADAIDGCWPGEGCGVLVLARTAGAAVLRVYAEIMGWGLARSPRDDASRADPAGDADTRLLALRRAYDHAGVPATQIRLFEGHGTTERHDAALAALTHLIGQNARARGWAAVGSIAGNIGHGGPAAGAASLIKAVLCVWRGMLPPSAASGPPHPLLTAPGAPLRVLDRPLPWPAGEPRLAGVSDMGFGDVHVHLIVRAPADDSPLTRPDPPSETHRNGTAKGTAGVTVAGTIPGGAPSPAEPLVFTFSGRGRAAVRAELRRIAERAADWSEAELHDLACTLAARPPGRCRAAVVAGTSLQLAERALEAARHAGTLREGRLLPLSGAFLGLGVRGRVTLLFPGQSVPDGGSAAHGAMADNAAAQPAVLDASLAALRELDLLGLNAGAAIGHDVGEITGMVWAGCLSAPEARRLVRRRGQLIDEVGSPDTGMIAVAAPRDVVDRLVTGTGLVVAAVNGPAAHVLSGRSAELDVAVERARAAGVAAERLPVSRALHSPHTADCGSRFAECLQGLTFRPAQRLLISTVTGHPVGPYDDLPVLLRAQLVAPVRFWDALLKIAPATDLFCHAGPGRGLAALAESTGVPAVSTDTYGPDRVAAAETAAALWAAAAIPDVTGLYADRPYRPLDLDLAAPVSRRPG
ncbi:type I polyketide synthase [Thermostaphylospora chromogena]|uniref:Acyl transferase domain-containing protein n=1 Tax=Thermostaphylospora chromogena TaxID=35622 RepID=A0A1H1AKF9_9ACTN|nr:type I polyketide synthase [Thermostaphylospora chromogena]SDQ40159.1 Acyl transferase domain-containing protein [Thermostaphylospora chromogena]